MRPHPFDLILGVLLGILVREEPHRSRRWVARGRAKLRVQFRIGEGREATSRVVEEQDLLGPKNSVGHDDLTEGVLGDRGTTRANHVDISARQAQYGREV